MEAIIYQNLKAEGAPINRILNLEIKNELNAYGSAYIEGEADYEQAQEYIQRVQPGTQITISTTAKGQPPKLFAGVISNISMRKEDEYAVLQIKLEAMASQLNVEKQNRSFQKSSSTYEEVINMAVGGKGIVDMKASDHPIGSLIMQYNETPWIFAMRMASALGAPICSNINTEVPILTIGIPDTGKSYDLKDVEYGYSSDGGSTGTTLTGMQTVQIGDRVMYGGKRDAVKKYCCRMQGGILMTTVYVIPEAEAQSINSGNGTAGENVPNQIMNTQAAGKMFTGIVQEVNLDKVKVHLTDIDSSFDGGGDFWFPYSTAYSSGDGSGFYCMPAQGDTVRVFFPSDNEKDAFAASSINVSPLADPKHKKWRTPGGKEILMTEQGMFITCKQDRIFINLEDENGITIFSEKDINVNSMSNMTLYAREGIAIHSESKILVSTGESYIDITSELIQMGAQQILIN